MSAAGPDVLVVGSGIVGTAVAVRLVDAGLRVQVLEKGPPHPHPHVDAPAQERRRHGAGRTGTDADVRDVSMSGSYRSAVADELVQRVGGMATRWRGIALRMRPEDFGPGRPGAPSPAWPMGYDDLEAHYCAAEQMMGVAGTDEDNPFAPPRSRPHPLPPLPLAPDDHVIARGLRDAGICTSTTPQAITSAPHDGRPACSNIGPTCNGCPTGARYSPVHHLDRVVATGRCALRTGTAVRRVLVDARGAVRAVVTAGPDGDEVEEPARTVVLAGGAIETARLLLLSSGPRNPDGLGNAAGLVGDGLTFHHMYGGVLRYDRPLHPGRVAPMTLQSHQFLGGAPGAHGIKVEMASHLPALRGRGRWQTAADVLASMDEAVRSRNLGLHAETSPGPGKRVTLSVRRDRWGDPFAHVQYTADDVDRATHAWGRQIAERIAGATGAAALEYRDPDDFHSVYHHMGTARMGQGVADGVCDSLGRVHGVPGLVVLGGAQFPSATPVNPTLTMLALALRAAPAIVELALGSAVAR